MTIPKIKSQVVYVAVGGAMLFMLFDDNSLYAVEGRMADDGKSFIMKTDSAERIELSESQLNDLYCAVMDLWDYRILKELYATRYFAPHYQGVAEVIAQN